MAEKKAMVTYDSVMRELKAGKYRPVYLLMGDESYFIDKIADFIKMRNLKTNTLTKIKHDVSFQKDFVGQKSEVEV